MKTRTLVGVAVLVALAVLAVGQTASRSGLGLHWQIPLIGDTARNTGTAVYETFRATAIPPATAKGKLVSKFVVETLTPDLANGSKLEVYLGPGETGNEPYGKLVGVIDVDRGAGAMILIADKVPVIREGSVVSVISHGDTAGRDNLLMQGTF